MAVLADAADGTFHTDHKGQETPCGASSAPWTQPKPILASKVVRPPAADPQRVGLLLSLVFKNAEVI